MNARRALVYASIVLLEVIPGKSPLSPEVETVLCASPTQIKIQVPFEKFKCHLKRRWKEFKSLSSSYPALGSFAIHRVRP